MSVVVKEKFLQSVFRKSLSENVEVFKAKGRTEQHSRSVLLCWLNERIYEENLQV